MYTLILTLANGLKMDLKHSEGVFSRRENAEKARKRLSLSFRDRVSIEIITNSRIPDFKSCPYCGK